MTSAGNPHRQFLEIRGQHDLARQATGPLHPEGEVEQVFFIVARGREPGEVVWRDYDVAGGTAHGAVTGALERLAGSLRDVKQARPGRSLDLAVGLAIGAKKGDEGHATKRRCASAAEAIRRQASVSSSSVV